MGSIAGAAMLVAGGTAQAVEFNFGETRVQVDTTVSIGAGMRTSSQDCANISSYNGGCAAGNGTDFGVNDDDGNVNTDQWDPYTMTLKATTDIDTRWRNFGAFVRVKAFYDYWVNEELGDHNNDYGQRPIVDASRGDQAQDYAGRSIDLLDAFVYGNFDVAGMPTTLRVGKQVINWGESLFIQGGISSYLPVDLSAIRTPGSELKEAYLPVPAVYGSIGLPGNVNVEAFWQFAWQKSELDGCGTYFATTDAACETGNYVMSGSEYGGAGVRIPRAEAEEGSDTGTFGVALKYYAENLGSGVDMGLYFTQQSLVVPIGTFSAGDFTTAVTPVVGPGVTTLAGYCGALGAATFGACLGTFPLGPGGPNAIALGLGAAAATKTYLTQYPEDVQTIGASFNTTIPVFGGSAFSGEMAFTPDMPFQISDIEINANDLDLVSGCEFVTGAPACSSSQAGAFYAPGQTIDGYDEYDVITAQLATISTLNPSSALPELINSDLMILVANVGFQYLPDLSDSANRLSAPRAGEFHPDFTANAILGDAACGPAGPGLCKAYYATSLSWGYRLAATADYNNVFGTSWTLTPVVQWAHDVSGYSAGPVGPGFVENKKTVSLGVNASYQQWRANVQYTNSFGNEYRNFSADKDFMTMTVSYAF
ncbi:MAG: DUF1302 domain-containing protein [Parvibaculum sp.]